LLNGFALISSLLRCSCYKQDYTTLQGEILMGLLAFMKNKQITCCKQKTQTTQMLSKKAAESHHHTAILYDF